PYFLFIRPSHPNLHTLSLHDALPISTQPRTSAARVDPGRSVAPRTCALTLARHSCVAERMFPSKHVLGRSAHAEAPVRWESRQPDRKSTRLNSSHVSSSYAVFCLKKR